MTNTCNTQIKSGLADDQATAFAKACGTPLEDYREVIAGVQFMLNRLGSIDGAATKFGMSKKAFKRYCRIHGIQYQGYDTSEL